MKIALFALLFGVCAALHLTPELVQDNIQGRVADKVFLQKQRDLLRLLRHVHQPNTYLDQVEIAKTFDIESNIALFEKPIVVQEFIQLYRYGMLPQKEIFSIMNDVHRRQVIAVFHLMYYAKTYDTFYRVACWCREHINQGMFVYALTVAVLHRPDCRGLILPPAYEIYPYYFINHETIKKAQELKMQDFAILKPEIYQRLLKDPKIMGKLPFTQDYEHMTSVYGKVPISQDYEHMTPIYGNLRTDDVLIQNQKPWMYQKPTSSIWSKKPWMMVDDVQRPYVTKDVPVMNEYQKSMYGQVPTYMDKTYYGKTMDKTSYLPKYMTHDDILVKNPLLYKNMLNTVQQNFVPEVYQTVEDGIPTVIIPTNYSGWYLNLDEEQQKLSYFMEDIGLNSYYYYFHMDYPFWMLGTETGLNKDRRGELYFYTLHQLINRYYLERLSNGLGEMGMLDITNPVPYVCTLVYENGLPFPMRPSKTDLVYDDYTKYVYERINILEKRIIDAIDLGYVIDVTGNKVPIYTQEGINILGNIIQGNADSVNRRYYGHLLKWVKILLGYAGKPLDNYKVQPSTLEIFATAMRDPMFYRIYRRIVHYFLNYKTNLPTYKYTDLLYQGVKVNSVDIDELITYFDYFNVELNNALYNDFTVTTTDVPKVLVKARQMRHRPYKCHLPDCGRAFIQLSNLQQHLRNHDAQVERAKNRPFHCNICGKGFATESSLRTHTSKCVGRLQQHAALLGGPHAATCPLCHRLFLGGGEELMEHMKHTHKDPNASGVATKRRTANHPCPICGKHYVNEGSLRKHLACHPETSQLANTGLRMYPCSACQAVFTHESGLLTHMEHMRMEQKHQFAAQIVLSRAAAERRERELFASQAAMLGLPPSASLVANAASLAAAANQQQSGQLTSGGNPPMSPSAHSDSSSGNGRLSSAGSENGASQQGNATGLLNNNNNNNNCTPKLGDILRNNNGLHGSQYNMDTDQLHVNRMAMMAAMTGAAHQTAAGMSPTDVANLAAAMRMGAVSQEFGNNILRFQANNASSGSPNTPPLNTDTLTQQALMMRASMDSMRNLSDMRMDLSNTHSQPDALRIHQTEALLRTQAEAALRLAVSQAAVAAATQQQQQAANAANQQSGQTGNNSQQNESQNSPLGRHNGGSNVGPFSISQGNQQLSPDLSDALKLQEALQQARLHHQQP